MNKETIEQINLYLKTLLVRIRSDVSNLNDKLDNLDSLVKTLEEIINKEENNDEGSA